MPENNARSIPTKGILIDIFEDIGEMMPVLNISRSNNGETPTRKISSREIREEATISPDPKCEARFCLVWILQEH